MKIPVKTYKYEKVEVSKDEIEIPEEPMYVFQTGIRRAIRIVPEWTTWNMETKGMPEYIHTLQVTNVYRSWENKIELCNIAVSGLEEMLTEHNKDGYNIARMLKSKYYNVRTKEQFEEDLQAVISKITGHDKSNRDTLQ